MYLLFKKKYLIDVCSVKCIVFGVAFAVIIMTRRNTHPVKTVENPTVVITNSVILRPVFEYGMLLVGWSTGSAVLNTIMIYSRMGVRHGHTLFKGLWIPSECLQ